MMNSPVTIYNYMNEIIIEINIQSFLEPEKKNYFNAQKDMTTLKKMKKFFFNDI